MKIIICLAFLFAAATSYAMTDEEMQFRVLSCIGSQTFLAANFEKDGKTMFANATYAEAQLWVAVWRHNWPTEDYEPYVMAMLKRLRDDYDSGKAEWNKIVDHAQQCTADMAQMRGS